MAKTEKLYRSIYAKNEDGSLREVPELEATRALADRVGLANIISVERQGNRYAAEVKVADDDDKADDNGDDNGGGDDKPAFLKSDEEKEAPEPKGDGDSDDSGPPEGDGESEGEDERSEPPFGEEDGEAKGSVDEQILDVLKSIAEALGAKPAGDDLGLDLGPETPVDAAGLDLPDVGAPPAGEALPPPVPAPPAGGLGGPGAGRPPKPGAMPSFAKVAGAEAVLGKKRVFSAEVQEASAVNNRQLLDEAAIFFPGYKVVKLDRTSKAEEDVAVLTLVGG